MPSPNLSTITLDELQQMIAQIVDQRVKCQLPCQAGDNYLSSRGIGSVPWLSDNYAVRD
jgi:hypothetical protein